MVPFALGKKAMQSWQNGHAVVAVRGDLDNFDWHGGGEDEWGGLEPEFQRQT